MELAYWGRMSTKFGALYLLITLVVEISLILTPDDSEVGEDEIDELDEDVGDGADTKLGGSVDGVALNKLICGGNAGTPTAVPRSCCCCGCCAKLWIVLFKAFAVAKVPGRIPPAAIILIVAAPVILGNTAAGM